MTARRVARRRLPVGTVRRRTPEERLTRSKALRAWLAGGLPELVGEWPVEARCAFDERAGICEFDGHIPRMEAETIAERAVRSEADREEVPSEDAPP